MTFLKPTGTQLLISFENGELTESGTLQVEFYLQCKQDAVWAIPISGSPGMLPSDTTVTLDQTNCKVRNNKPSILKVVGSNPNRVISIWIFFFTTQESNGYNALYIGYKGKNI